MAAIQTQIKAEGGPKLAKAQAKVDSLVEQLSLLNKKLVQSIVEEASSRKQVRHVYPPVTVVYSTLFSRDILLAEALTFLIGKQVEDLKGEGRK